MGIATSTNKVLFMGLGSSGKSSIRSIVFEGKSIDDVKDYNATINYIRSNKQIVDSSIQIFDCGGQESFISAFVGEKAEFIFNNVSTLIWVVDASNIENISTSKFYFDLAVKKLIEFSPTSVIFCLFHKRDLLNPDTHEEIINTMKQYFVTDENVNIKYRGTSIYDNSLMQVMGEIIQRIILNSTKAKTVSNTIQNYIIENNEVSGIAIYSDDGLPVFEEGELSELIILPANLWLANYDRLKDEFKKDDLKATLETEKYIFVFKRIINDLLFGGVAKKFSSLQYLLVKMDSLANIVSNLL